MKRIFNNYLLAFVLVVSIFSSCSDNGSNESIESQVTYELKGSLTKEEIQLFMLVGGLIDLVDEIKYGVDIYYVEYPFNYLGVKTIASGLVCVPQSEGGAFPVLSFQHGTMVKKSEAPTASISSPLTKGIAAMAGGGYIVSIPDMIGFGASSDYLHPYFNKQANAEASIELLNALHEIPAGDLSGVHLNTDLYLSGYSQGGWITLAVLETIEKELYEIKDFNVKAVVCGAGPYDPAIVMEYAMGLEEYPQPFYMPYVLLSFKEEGYDIGNLNKYFQEPYATNIPSLYDGTLKGSEINTQLTTVTADFYTELFLTNSDNSEFAVVNKAMAENSIEAWATNTPLLFIHGDADTYVPKETSIVMHDQMLEKGGSNVYIELLPNRDHTTAAISSIGKSLLYFKTLQ